MNEQRPAETLETTNEPIKDSVQESATEAPDKKKAGLTAKIKRLFRFRLQLVSRDAPKEESGEGKEKKNKKPQKDKKPKKDKNPKPKKQKPQKIKRSTVPEKKRSRLPLLIAVGAVLLGGGAGIFFLLRSANTPEALLKKALGHMEKERYVEAVLIYNKLIEEEAALPEAYLGLADAFLAAEDTAAAVTKLQAGLDATGDERIADKLAELDSESTDPGAVPAPPAEQIIVWTDPALEKMVRIALGKPNPQNISVSDVSSIHTLKILGDTHAVVNDHLASYNTTDSYTIDRVEFKGRGTISSLADLAHFRNLRRLTVAFNQVSDLSGLSSLPSLEMLGLYNNEVEDISVLSGLSSLKYLYIYNNRIKDISSLQTLTLLEDVWLQHNEIQDLAPLRGLPNLAEIHVDYNELEEIDIITTLPNLFIFYAGNNHIADISPVAEVDTLTDVFFTGNTVTDYSPAAHVQNINKPYGRKFP